MICKICRDEIKRGHKYICCDVYQNDFHLKCAGVSEDECKIIILKKSIKYVCSNCDINQVYCMKNILDQIKDLKDDFKSCMAIVEENSKIIKELNTNKNVDGDKNASYSNILKKDIEKIILKPKGEQDCSKTTDEIKRKVDPVKLAVGIENVKNLRNGSIMISCNDKTSKEKLTNVVNELGENCQVEEVKMNMPKMILVNTEEEYVYKSDEEIVKDMVEQNDLGDEAMQKFKIIKNTKEKIKQIVEILYLK